MSVQNRDHEKLSITDMPTRRGQLQSFTTETEMPTQVPPIVYEVLRSPGQPLDRETRDFMEARFLYDFGNVRVHKDIRAAKSAEAVNALAYTVGQDVVFRDGQYAPRTGAGRRLLAHELTHVVQQSNIRPGIARDIDTSARLEHDARETAFTVDNPRKEIRISPTMTALSVQRASENPSQPKANSHVDQDDALQKPIDRTIISAINRVKGHDKGTDYTKAGKVITEYFNRKRKLLSAVINGLDRGVIQFYLHSTIQSGGMGANITYQLARIVLGVLPSVRAIKGLFEGSAVALQAAAVSAQRTAAFAYYSATAKAQPNTAASRALDWISTIEDQSGKAIDKEESSEQAKLEGMLAEPAWQGQLRIWAQNNYRPESTEADGISKNFQRLFELALYIQFYTPMAVVGPLGIKGVPEPVQHRLQLLAGKPAEDVLLEFGAAVETYNYALSPRIYPFILIRERNPIQNDALMRKIETQLSTFL